MPGWVRYSMWDRWRDLTRFRLASEMALASYRTYVNDFPVTSPAELTVHDPSGDSQFKCGLDDFKLVLNDDEVLYRTIFPSYVALTEDLARDLIARIRSGARFEDLASRHSTHTESASKGGDLGTHAGCRWAKATLEMLDSLKRGQTWPKPVKGTHGWGIYRLESVADIEPRPFSQYRSELLSGSFEPECPWVPPVTVAPAGKGDAGKENAGKGNAVGSGIERR